MIAFTNQFQTQTLSPSVVTLESSEVGMIATEV